MEFDKSQFWKPNEITPTKQRRNEPVDESVVRENDEQSKLFVYNPFQNYSLAQQRQALPIYQYKNEILYLIETYQVLVVIGQTGSGKSTQIPQYLYEAKWAEGGRVIACTQPRRIAAQELAERVAEEKGVTLGETVGYSVRFDDRTHPELTRIKYLTDGMLLRETMLDPLLSKYSVIMIDEAHERSLYSDIILGLLKKILKRRPDLRLVVSSATLEAEQFFNFFSTNETNDKTKDNCFILSIPGRTFPIDVFYAESPCRNYLKSMVDTVMQIHNGTPSPGDILCFLTGQYEIEQVCEMLRDASDQVDQFKRRGAMRLQVLALYSGLAVDLQRKVFEKPAKNFRKVIVATNVAETSLTIPGIVYVVDCGFEKIRLYDPVTHMDSLVVVGCSQSSARQRAGRAGRQQPGQVYRLYTQNQYERMAPQALPEIQRANLAHCVMQLKALGIDDILHFDFLSPPPDTHMMNALEMLYALKILDDSCKLTPFGQVVVEFPIEPSLARMLLASDEFQCAEEMLTIVAMLSVPSVWVVPRDFRSTADKAKMHFAVQEGDIITLLNVYNHFQEAKNKTEWCKRNYVSMKILYKAEQVRKQLRKYVRRFSVTLRSSSDTVAIRKAIICGLFANVAQIQPDGSYKTIRGNHILHLHPSSVLFKFPPAWVLYYEVVKTKKEYMREVIEVDPLWLGELVPHFYDYKKRKPQPSQQQL